MFFVFYVAKVLPYRLIIMYACIKIYIVAENYYFFTLINDVGQELEGVAKFETISKISEK